LKKVQAIIALLKFNYEDTRTAVALIGNQCQSESSGGITEKHCVNMPIAV